MSALVFIEFLVVIWRSCNVFLPGDHLPAGFADMMRHSSFFWKGHSHLQLSFHFARWWQRWRRAWWEKTSSPGLITRVEGVIIHRRVRRLPSVTCADNHEGRRYRWRFRRLWWLWAVVLIMPFCCRVCYRHCCKDIKWTGRYLQIIQALWNNWEPYGIVGSFESESIVTISGSGDAIDDIDIISRVPWPDISVELRTIGVIGLGRFASLDDCST